MKSRAVFFDKDGTLIKDVPYNVDPELIELTEGAGESLRLLRQNNFRLFVVSNQSGVARGHFEESELDAVWRKLEELSGVEFDGFYFCPHYPEGIITEYSFECDCRKPADGLIRRAAVEQNIDLENSWFIGDSPKDVSAGRRAGCRTILYAPGESLRKGDCEPDFAVKDLRDAAKLIVKAATSFRA